MAQLTIVPKIHRRYIYGTDYIDEVVQQHNFTTTGAPSTYHVLQDANWDVIALANTSGTLAEQYALDPYGQRFAAERVNTDGTLTNLDPLTGAATLLTRNGLFLNPYTGNLENRARTLNARLLRMNQRDPNDTALITASLLSHGGHAQSFEATFSETGQYLDGLGIYLYTNANPVTGLDPTGLTTAYLPNAEWGSTLDGVEDAIANARRTQDTLWAEDWGSDDYGAAILDYIGSRESAIAGIDTAYAKAMGGLQQSRLYAKSAALWLQFYFDYLTPEGSVADIDLSSMLEMMELTECFAAGTRVTLADGTTTAIEHIVPGVEVLSRNHDCGLECSPVIGRVTNAFSRVVNKYLSITVGSEILLVTAEHPFFEVGIGWVPASKLQSGSIIAANSGPITVTSATIYNEPLRVFNFEVEGTHTYFVGKQCLWVHNNCAEQIHHIIPRQLRDHPLLKAVNFKMNDAINKVPLSINVHSGPHEQYTMGYIKP